MKKENALKILEIAIDDCLDDIKSLGVNEIAWVKSVSDILNAIEKQFDGTQFEFYDFIENEIEKQVGIRAGFKMNRLWIKRVE